MQKNIMRRIVVALAISALAFAAFSRTPGAENVRAVEILMLMASGMGLGVALALFRIGRQL